MSSLFSIFYIPKHSMLFSENVIEEEEDGMEHVGTTLRK